MYEYCFRAHVSPSWIGTSRKTCLDILGSFLICVRSFVRRKRVWVQPQATRHVFTSNRISQLQHNDRKTGGAGLDHTRNMGAWRQIPCVDLTCPRGLTRFTGGALQMERKHNAAKSLRCKIASPDCNKFGLGLVRVSTYHVQASRQLDGSTRLRKNTGAGTHPVVRRRGCPGVHPGSRAG